VITHSGALNARIGSGRDVWHKDIIPALNGRYGDWQELDLADRHTIVPDAVTVHGEVMAAVAQHGRPLRIFILGGHEVVPLGWVHNPCYSGSEIEQSIIIQPLPGMTPYQHTFIYSDDPYAEFDGDGILDVPIARLPDGGDYTMVMAQLGGGSRQQGGGFALSLPDRPAQVTARRFGLPYYESPPYGYVPQAPRFVPPPSRYGYFSLHGGSDNSVWAGEDAETKDIRMVFSAPDAGDVNVVVSIACFGAYIAPHWNGASRTWVEKTTQNSIALHFLANGTDTFIGSTDVGYDIWRWKRTCTKKIPILGICVDWGGIRKKNEMGYGSSLMAQYIFEALAQGANPMDALFNAKRRYGLESAVGSEGPFTESGIREYNTRLKTLWQFIYYGPPPF
jgi:hypothetical protein